MTIKSISSIIVILILVIWCSAPLYSVEDKVILANAAKHTALVDKVISLLDQRLNVRKDKGKVTVTPQSRLVKDLNMEFEDLIQLMIDVEDMLGVKVPDSIFDSHKEISVQAFSDNVSKLK